MKLKCKICGSENFTFNGEQIICGSCGCKYSINKAKELTQNKTSDLQSQKTIHNNENIKPSSSILKNNSRKGWLILAIVMVFIAISINFIYFVLPKIVDMVDINEAINNFTSPKKEISQNGYLFKLNDSNTYTIISHINSNDKQEITIPIQINEIPVTEIASDAFRHESNKIIKTLIVTKSITKINKGAFHGLKTLEKIILPFIGSGDKYYNTNFAYIFNTSIDNSYISEAIPSTLNTVILLDSCTYIDDLAFAYCDQIQNIYIPSTVKMIGNTTETNMYLEKLPFKSCSDSLTIHLNTTTKPQEWHDMWNYQAKNYALATTWGAILNTYDYTIIPGQTKTASQDYSKPKTIMINTQNIANYININCDVQAINYESTVFERGYTGISGNIKITPKTTEYIFENVTVQIDLVVWYTEVKSTMFKTEKYTNVWSHISNRTLNANGNDGVATYHFLEEGTLLKDVNSITYEVRIKSASGTLKLIK